MLALIRNKLPSKLTFIPILSLKASKAPFKHSYSLSTASQTSKPFFLKAGLTTTYVHCFSTASSLNTSIHLIRTTCQQLLEIQSITLDNLSIVFGTHYLPRKKFSQEHLYIKHSDMVIRELREKIKKIAPESNIDPIAMFNNLKIVFDFLSNSKVGFLRGDLHTLTYFQLQKDIQDKLSTYEQRNEVYYEQDDFKRVLLKATSPVEFRLPFKGIYRRQFESKVNLYHRQLLLEEVTSHQSHMHFQQILDSLMKLNKVHQVNVLRRFMADWILPLTTALKAQQSKCMNKQISQARKVYGPDLIKISPEKIASAALTELIICIFQQIYKQGTIDQFDIQLFDGIEEKKYISRTIKTIEAQISFEKQQLSFRECQRQYDMIIKKEGLTKHKQNNSQNMDMNANDNKNKEVKDPRHWKSETFKAKQKQLPYKYVPPLLRKEFVDKLQAKINRFKPIKSQFTQQVETALGSIIVYILKEILTVENSYGYKVPFLTSDHRTLKKNHQYLTVSLLRVNQNFLNQIIPKLEKTEDLFIHMERSLPTIIEPLPWIDPQIGGYYSQATTVMKYSHCPVQQRVLKYADNHRAFSVLNTLSRTPWKINKKVLDIVEEIWISGGQVSCVPRRYSEMLNTYTNKLKMENNPRRRKQLTKKIQQIRDQFSLRGDFNLKLGIARAFSKIDYFYFPHNFDFRGRVYPIPPHFNHIGNDLVRGLLLFGKGKRIGPQGLRWMKIHTANLMGKDKAPIDQKLVFIDQNLQKIHSIADNPLKYREWLEYEDCWQAIGSIIDLSTALRQKNPEDYVSCLHIHQDGSCNGLQHYAALGRDTEGAYQVNLGPAPKPSDIYTHVSKMVIKMIEADLNGPPAEHHIMARKLIGNIKRKTVKQTVMTSVYGVTFIGARQQIYKQLQNQNFMSEDENYAASIYLARLTLEAISNLFTGAHGIKQWFRQCASKVSQTGNPVGWITPLGLPVVEPYRRMSKLDTIRTISHNMHLTKNIQNIPLNKTKQATAFPPNYVHSLDSSHMMYTAQECSKIGLTFAAVHDSYWTHAATVDQMNVLLREQFIRLHSQPLLQTFRDSLNDRFPEIEFPPIPERGDFDLQKIKERLFQSDVYRSYLSELFLSKQIEYKQNMGLVYSLTSYFYPTTPQLSAIVIKTKTTRLSLCIKQAQYRLQQATMKLEDNLIDTVSKNKHLRNKEAENIAMELIIRNSERMLVYDELLLCLVTIKNSAPALQNNPKDISNECVKAISSLIFVYQPLNLHQFVNLNEFIPEPHPQIPVNQTAQRIQKYLGQKPITHYQRNLYACQISQRRNLPLEVFNEVGHNFETNPKQPEEESPSAHMFAITLEEVDTLE